MGHPEFSREQLEAPDRLGDTIGREAVKMAAALEAPLAAFRSSAKEALRAIEAMNAAQLRLDEVLRPPSYPQVVIFGRSFDADLLAYGALALAALLYGGL